MAGLVPAITSYLRNSRKTWMPATSAGMTTERLTQTDWEKFYRTGTNAPVVRSSTDSSPVATPK